MLNRRSLLIGCVALPSLLAYQSALSQSAPSLGSATLL